MKIESTSSLHVSLSFPGPVLGYVLLTAIAEGQQKVQAHFKLLPALCWLAFFGITKPKVNGRKEHAAFTGKNFKGTWQRW